MEVWASHLTVDQASKAVTLFEKAYVTFALTARQFSIKKKAVWERQAAEQAEAAKREVASKGGSSSSATEKEVKPKLDSGVSYGESRWSDDNDDDDDDDVQGSTEESALREGYLAKARKSFKAWRRVKVDWVKEFERDVKLTLPLDPVHDLLPLDVGKLYKKLEASDAERKVYGYIPLMASCSYGQIGALNAEVVQRAFPSLCR